MAVKGFKAGIYKICLECKKSFYCYQSQVKSGKRYCSKGCWHKQQGAIQKGDERYIVGLKKALTMLPRGKDASERNRNNALAGYRSGKLKLRIGEMNNLWKGGISTLQNRMRNSAEYKNWRTKVFERDEYTCRKCEKTGGELHAHHIKEFAQYEKLRFDIENGMTLCLDCHRKVHNRYIPSIKDFTSKIKVVLQ